MSRTSSRFATPVLVLLAACGSASVGCSTEEEPAPFAEAQPTRSRFERDTGVPWLVAEDPSSKDVRFIAPQSPVEIGHGSPESRARELFLTYAAELHGSGDPAELGSAEVIGGDVTTVRIPQRLPGTTILVRGAVSVATFLPDGKLMFAEPSFFADLGHVPKRAAVAADRAVAIARTYLDEACGGSNPDAKLEVELVVDAGRGPSRLEYRIADPTVGDVCFAPTVRVDATTGIALGHDTEARHANTVSVGGVRHHLFSEAKDIKTVGYETSGSSVVLRSDKVEVVQENPIVGALPVTKSVAAASAAEWESDIRFPGGRGAAVDAVRHLELTASFYERAPFRYRGIANDGGKTRVVVHDTHKVGETNNALGAMYVRPGTNGYILTDTIYVGDGPRAHGAGQRASYAAALDLMAHEYTHGVVAHTSRLLDYVPVQAVEEAFCDIMGATVEHASRPNGGRMAWLTGEDASNERAPMRSLDAPSSVIGALGADHWTEWFGDPHALGGVGTRAFAFAVKGGVDAKMGVHIRGGVGWDRAALLWFDSVTRSAPAVTLPGLAMKQTFLAARWVGSSEGAKLDTKHENYAAFRSVACGWRAVGLTTAADFLAVDCKPVLEGGSLKPSGSSCAGTTGTAYICQEEAPYAAYVCKDGSIAGGVTCKAPSTSCVHPSDTDFTATLVDGELRCE